MSLALFDFDGTITTHETMPVFERRSVNTRRLWLGHCLLAPMIIGYKLGIVSGVRVRSAIENCTRPRTDHTAARRAASAPLSPALSREGRGSKSASRRYRPLIAA